MKLNKSNKGRQFRRMIRTVIALITIMPIVAFMYLFTNVKNEMPTETVLTSAIIIFIGWVVMLDMLLLHMLKLHVKSQAAIEKMQEKGMLEEPNIKSGVESLESVFTTLTTKVKESFEGLKEMSAQIDTLNGELAKKMNALVTIMHIHEIYTQGRHEEEIFVFIIDKLKEMLKLTKVELILENGQKQFVPFLSGNKEDAIQNPFADSDINFISELNKTATNDNNGHDRSLEFLCRYMKVNNCFVVPLLLRDNMVGFLAGGNCLENFSFSKDDISLINILSKNIVLLWEHKKLSHAVAGLEIYDPLTTLYNRKYILNRLDEEIKRAVLYQRPCGLLMLEISNLEEIKKSSGAIAVEKLLKEIATTFKDTLRPIDISARVEENHMAAILIEHNRRQCQVTVKKVQEALNKRFENSVHKITFRYAVGETPIDGRSADELIAFASTHLKNIC